MDTDEKINELTVVQCMYLYVTPNSQYHAYYSIGEVLKVINFELCFMSNYCQAKLYRKIIFYIAYYN